MEIQDCIYEPVKKRGFGSILKVGGACACCRLAKTHMEILRNDALTFDFPPPGDTHQNKKEGERAIFVSFSRSSDQLNLRTQYRNATLSVHVQRVSWPIPSQSVHTTTRSVHSQPAQVLRTGPTVIHQGNDLEAPIRSGFPQPHLRIRRVTGCLALCRRLPSWT
jgi:hypothetical protein